MMPMLAPRRTPLEAWRDPFLFKREDLSETGSHKDRAARRQAQHFHAAGAKALVLSSSGNAARATAAAARNLELPVYAFMSPKTPADKVLDVIKYGGTAIFSKRPINLANYVARVFEIPNTRPSRCNISLEGFKSLGEELVESYGEGAKFDSVFIFSSSGSSLVALGHELMELRGSVTLQAVQAGPVCPIVADFDCSTRIGRAPRTGSLCAKKTPRATEAQELIKSLGGSGWIVTDEEVDEAEAALLETGMNLARESSAALSAAMRALSEGSVERPLVVSTGKAVSHEQVIGEVEGLYVLDEYLDAKAFFERESLKWKS